MLSPTLSTPYFKTRPLLEALQEYHCDYLFQVKDNQPKILAKMKVFFKDAEHQEPNDVMPCKKGDFRISPSVGKKMGSGGCS